MATKKQAPAKKGVAKKTADTSDAVDELGAAIAALGRSVDHSSELDSLRHLDTISDNIGELATSLNAVAQALAASVIAQHGSADERAKIIEHLKTWFWRSEIFRE